ncbi:hypothetical protein JW859_06745 [bacterium]|nr:hypothetical protein [bacterium]
MIAVLLVLSCLGCSTKNIGSLGDPGRDTARFTMTVDDESFFNGASADEFYLSTREYDTHVLVDINARGADSLKALYFKMEYDAETYRPEVVQPSDAMGDTSDMLKVQIFRNPGEVAYGQIVTNPDWRTGANGDVTLATVSFRKEAFSEGHIVSTPPNKPASAVGDLAFDGTDTLTWHYVNIGDYNQDGEVGVADLTPIGVNFGEDVTPNQFDFNTALSVIDGNSNGQIEVADITPIGQNYLFNIFGGFRIYGSQNFSDYNVDGNGGATLIDTVTIGDDAIGTASQVRLSFEYTIGAPVANDFYWVRPTDGASAEGVISNFCGGDQTQFPVLTLTNPPSGAGTSASPYQANITTDYVFSLVDPTDGDVTNDANTTYTVSNPAAGSIATADATLNIEDAFTGTFFVTATYNGTPNRSDTTRHFNVAVVTTGLYIMQDTTDTDWASVTGTGVDGDPYIIRTATFNDDYSADFTLMANTEDDGSGTDIDVSTLDWAAYPPFCIEDPAWGTPGVFQANSVGFTGNPSYVFANDGDGDSNEIHIRATGTLP